ncbi:MAG: hypothetical protein ACJ8GK_10875 [Luteimonas sp.]
MSVVTAVLLATACVFCGMLVFGEVGRRIGARRLARNPEGLAQGAGAAEAAVFALLGLLIAFTFSGAASRFEDRRHLLTEEANAIGTAYLRVDMLPDDLQPDIRRMFRQYTKLRASTYVPGDEAASSLLQLENRAEADRRIARAAALQSAIWKAAVRASRRPGTPAQVSMLVLPALNNMIDITTTRVMATRNHPPAVILLLLVGLGWVGALLAGYATSANVSRDWFHSLVFAGILSLTMYVIVDLEYPRLGLIRVDAADQVLVELRRSM